MQQQWCEKCSYKNESEIDVSKQTSRADLVDGLHASLVHSFSQTIHENLVLFVRWTDQNSLEERRQIKLCKRLLVNSISQTCYTFLFSPGLLPTLTSSMTSSGANRLSHSSSSAMFLKILGKCANLWKTMKNVSQF